MNNKPFYQYTREELLDHPRIPLDVYPEEEAIFRKMAGEMISIIKENKNAGKPTVMIVPVGPVGQYPYFVEQVIGERISLNDVVFINMDEYLTSEDQFMDINHEMSFRGFMEREVHGKIPEDLRMPEENRVFPDPENLDAISRVLSEYGKLDAVFGGIGINGHVAFNEADASLTVEEFSSLATRVCGISLETLVVNSLASMDGAFYDMPHRCVTVGFKEILQAKRIRLGVFRPWHRSVVRRAAHDLPTASFPVTILGEHNDILVMVPESIAR